MNNVFLDDVLNQPQAMRQAIAAYRNYAPQLAKISALKHERVLLCGMGSSHACSYGAVITLNQAGIPARMETASQILHYEPGSLCLDTLLVLTSQSGESGEIAAIVDALPPQMTVIGITNDPNSTLGRRADICLLMQVQPELAVSTRTYLASLILSDMAAQALSGGDPMTSLDRWEAAVDALDAFLADYTSLQRRIGDFFGDPPVFNYISRGFARSTAEAASLFTQETAKYPAMDFESGQFRHGPFEMVESGFCAMIFAPEGAGYQMQRSLAETIAKHGGRVAFVTDSDLTFESDHILVLRHRAVGERYASLVQIAAGQLFANGMALHRGFAPGVFRQSNKITTVQ